MRIPQTGNWRTDGARLHRAKPVRRSRTVLPESSGGQSELLAGSEEPRGSVMVCREARGTGSTLPPVDTGIAQGSRSAPVSWTCCPRSCSACRGASTNLRVPENSRLPTRMCFRRCSKVILRLETGRYQEARRSLWRVRRSVRSSRFARRPCSTVMVALNRLIRCIGRRSSFRAVAEPLYLALASFASAHQNNGYGLEILDRGLQVIPARRRCIFITDCCLRWKASATRLWLISAKAAVGESAMAFAGTRAGECCNSRTGNTAESADTFGRFFENIPDDPSAAYLRALALSRTGDAASSCRTDPFAGECRAS